MSSNQDAGRSILGWITKVAAIVLLIGATLPFMAPATHAAIDTFIRIDGIDGSSKDAAHKNWIQSSSMVAGDLNGDAQADRIGSQGSGAGAGKVTTAAPRDAASGLAAGKRMHKPFTITKEVDQASRKLFELCASGKHISEVDVDMGSAHYKLQDVVISSATKSSSGGRPMETLTFNYTKIEMTQ
jgi:type VI secretion system secreted protein Hcp